MSTFNAAAWIDHHRGQVLLLYADPHRARRIKSHFHYTRQHGDEARSEGIFFGQVCDALAGANQIVATGSLQAQADFRKYIGEHAQNAHSHIVAWETVDFPARGQLLALAQHYFDRGEKSADASDPR